MKVAVYPGTFDPITLGHLDIIRRGAHLVDKLVIGVTTNPSKEPMFSVAERLAMVRREVADIPGRIEVVEFGSLLMTFALALYSTGEIGLLFVIIMFGAHFIPSILNVLIAPFCLPKATLPEKPVKASREKSARARHNPFTPAKPKKGKNPFADAKSRD